MKNDIYTLDSQNGIWHRVGYLSIEYSDGDETENQLLSKLKQCVDVSAQSAELLNCVDDWPSDYHFNPARHNLLRFFEIGPKHAVLELGCGCGAMTRYLGETGATVVAVEGSKRRAQIAALRCRDLQNITIYCDNLIDFVYEEKFDFVTLIGVLEYAPKFIKSSDPVKTCLDYVRSFLKEDGALVLAIENQLGLKYFNGCLEDHVGIPFYGINDLYGSTDPVTFGRHTLSEKLSSAGFSAKEFFYPFPDYKLPGLILTEEALRDTRLNVADLLIHNTGRNYPETHHRAFAEDLVWRLAIKNQLVPDLANSFLVLAHMKQPNRHKTDWLARMYSRGRRRSCYQIESVISANSSNQLVVQKWKLFPAAPAQEDGWLDHVVTNTDYLPGNLLIVNIHDAMAREANIAELAACFAPWLNFLLDRATSNNDGMRILPGNFVDCIPSNLIESPTGELSYFDAEWVSNNPVPLGWVVIRGITYSVIGCLENNSLKKQTYRSLISKVAGSSGINLDDSDFAVAHQWESRLVNSCHSNAKNTPTLSSIYDEPLHLVGRFRPNLKSELDWHQKELSRVKNTFSWRVTAPLRVAWNLFQKLAGKVIKITDGN